MNHNFRIRLQSGELLIGTMSTLVLAEVAEPLTSVGFDWLFINAEHSPMAGTDTLLLAQSAAQLLGQAKS